MSNPESKEKAAATFALIVMVGISIIIWEFFSAGWYALGGITLICGGWILFRLSAWTREE